MTACLGRTVRTGAMVEPMTSTTAPTTDDRTGVIETTIQMAWLADRRQWSRLVDVFATEVDVDYSGLTGGAAVRVARHDLVNGWKAALGGLTATQHLLGNQLVDMSGDNATVTAAFQATHVLANATGGPIWTLGGHYRFELVRAADGWRIAVLVMTPDWATGNQHIMTLAAGATQ
jgi:hypothetical protein